MLGFEIMLTASVWQSVFLHHKNLSQRTETQTNKQKSFRASKSALCCRKSFCRTDPFHVHMTPGTAAVVKHFSFDLKNIYKHSAEIHVWVAVTFLCFVSENKMGPRTLQNKLVACSHCDKRTSLFVLWSLPNGVFASLVAHDCNRVKKAQGS